MNNEFNIDDVVKFHFIGGETNRGIVIDKEGDFVYVEMKSGKKLWRHISYCELIPKIVCKF